jgi:hypothetical protein
MTGKNRAARSGGPVYVAFVRTELQLSQAFDAALADVLTLVIYDILGVVAKNASWLILFQYNGGTVNIDFQRVLLGNVERTAQFNRQYDTAQLIHFSYDPG